MSSSQSSQLPNASKPPSVPDHELLRCIGRGAYGEVWLARSITGAFRAVKIVSRQSFDHERPFEREFEGILKFEPISRRHDSQVDILHVGRGEDYFYYVMELADDQATGGQINPDNYVPRTLKSDLLFHGRLPFEECVRIGVALTTALEHLHENDLVHRDVKPSNIIFVNGVAKLADIGLVTSVDATRSYVGTEGFAAPEGPGSPKADLYSLGKVLYEISTGKDRQEFPELPTQLRELPDREGVIELNAVIARACRHDPKERYESAQAMHAELALLQSGKSLARLHRIEKRLRFVQRAGALITVLAGIIAIGWLWQARQTKVVRDLAASNARLANEKATIAEQSRQRLIQTQTANGLRFMENEDFATAALWFAEVLKSANGDAELERRQRDRLAALFARFPKPIARFSMGCSGSGVKVSPDGKWLIGVGRQTNNGVVTGEVRIWDTTTFQQLYSLSMPSIDGRVFVSPSGRWALTSTDKEKQIWDVAKGELVGSNITFAGISGETAWLADGTKVATVSDGGTNVYLIAASSGSAITSLVHSNPVTLIACDPSGRWIGTVTRFRINQTTPERSEVKIWDAGTGGLINHLFQTDDIVGRLTFSADGAAVAVIRGGDHYNELSRFYPKIIDVFDLPSGRQRFPQLTRSDTVADA
ncbi:MAG TPA: serine/threonine-protein kinase, partial [Verrucomicrobiae bacterium]|nr:serine/threonine-protein kinase [Verrucomicrobiae bacterium]